MDQVEQLLDESVSAKGYVIRDQRAPYDLSKVDFQALQELFRQGRKRTEAEKLRGAISTRLQRMVRLNRSRMNYLETFQRMIDEYNIGARNVDEFFEQLIEFAQQLEQEDQRAIAENLSEEELAVFDLITRPDPGLTEPEKRQVRQIARDLLSTLKAEKLVLDWRKHQATRAAVEVSVRDWIWRLPKRYPDALCQQKTALVYQHIYDNYQSAAQNIYALAA